MPWLTYLKKKIEVITRVEGMDILVVMIYFTQQTKLPSKPLGVHYDIDRSLPVRAGKEVKAKYELNRENPTLSEVLLKILFSVQLRADFTPCTIITCCISIHLFLHFKIISKGSASFSTAGGRESIY